VRFSALSAVWLSQVVPELVEVQSWPFVEIAAMREPSELDATPFQYVASVIPVN